MPVLVEAVQLGGVSQAEGLQGLIVGVLGIGDQAALLEIAHPSVLLDDVADDAADQRQGFVGMLQRK